MASDLEREWYGLCDKNDFIEKTIVGSFVQRLNAAGKHVAVSIGLHNFNGTQCPRCGASGHFKIHFLGALNHTKCGCKWYMAPGSYIGFQLSSVFHTGIRAGGGMKDDSDRKGERGGWVAGVLGFTMAAVFRLALAVVLIPIQAIVSLSQSKPDRAATVGGSR